MTASRVINAMPCSALIALDVEGNRVKRGRQYSIFNETDSLKIDGLFDALFCEKVTGLLFTFCEKYSPRVKKFVKTPEVTKKVFRECVPKAPGRAQLHGPSGDVELVACVK